MFRLPTQRVALETHTECSCAGLSGGCPLLTMPLQPLFPWWVASAGWSPPASTRPHGSGPDAGRCRLAHPTGPAAPRPHGLAAFSHENWELVIQIHGPEFLPLSTVNCRTAPSVGHPSPVPTHSAPGAPQCDNHRHPGIAQCPLGRLDPPCESHGPAGLLRGASLPCQGIHLVLPRDAAGGSALGEVATSGPGKA